MMRSVLAVHHRGRILDEPIPFTHWMVLVSGTVHCETCDMFIVKWSEKLVVVGIGNVHGGYTAAQNRRDNIQGRVQHFLGE